MKMLGVWKYPMIFGERLNVQLGDGLPQTGLKPSILRVGRHILQ